jgi:hypothetical protein
MRRDLAALFSAESAQRRECYIYIFWAESLLIWPHWAVGAPYAVPHTQTGATSPPPPPPHTHTHTYGTKTACAGHRMGGGEWRCSKFLDRELHMWWTGCLTNSKLLQWNMATEDVDIFFSCGASTMEGLQGTRSRPTATSRR